MLWSDMDAPFWLALQHAQTSCISEVSYLSGTARANKLVHLAPCVNVERDSDDIAVSGKGIGTTATHDAAKHLDVEKAEDIGNFGLWSGCFRRQFKNRRCT